MAVVLLADPWASFPEAYRLTRFGNVRNMHQARHQSCWGHCARGDGALSSVITDDPSHRILIINFPSLGDEAGDGKQIDRDGRRSRKKNTMRV